MPDVSKDLVELLVYVILPESVDCLANHVLGISHFSFHTKASWVARLTVRSWMLEEGKAENPEEGKEALSSGEKSKALGRGLHLSKSHQGKEDDPIVLPGRLLPALKQLDKTRYDEHNLRPMRVVLRVSSIITSTNSFGDFSKTAIISKIIPGSKLRRAGEKAQQLWRIFVHQPQTARCLVFLLLLGMLCQEIAKQFRDAANYFVNILNLDVSLRRNILVPCLHTLINNFNNRIVFSEAISTTSNIRIPSGHCGWFCGAWSLFTSCRTVSMRP
jgi:hypothetical protein